MSKTNKILITIDSDSASQLRYIIDKESSRLGQLEFENPLLPEDKERNKKLISGLLGVSKEIYNYQIGSTPKIDLVAIYCNLLLCNNKEEVRQTLDYIWCALNEEEREEVLIAIKKRQ
jgi:hypothetical protein